MSLVSNSPNLPISLTLSRLLLSPIFVSCYLYYGNLGISQKFLPFVLLFILGLSELTDFLDGYFARKRNQVSRLGKILDPMADSITRVTMLLTFTQGFVQVPLMLVFVFIYRDGIIGTLRTVCAFKGVTLAARTSGKVKALLQGLSLFAILCLMIFYTYDYLSLHMFQRISHLIIAFSALYTAFAGGEYIWSNRSYIKQIWKGTE